MLPSPQGAWTWKRLGASWLPTVNALEFCAVATKFQNETVVGPPPAGQVNEGTLT